MTEAGAGRTAQRVGVYETWRGLPEYRYLSTWLTKATRGLADESRARVREEITEHFRDALEDGVARGLSEAAAAEQAVENLGSPRKARRAFLRTYLTESDARELRYLMKPPTGMRAGLIFYLSATWFLATIGALVGRPRWQAQLALTVIATVGATVILGVTPRRLRARGQTTAAIATANAGRCLLFIPALFVGTYDRFDWAIAAGWILIGLESTRRLSRKVNGPRRDPASPG